MHLEHATASGEEAEAQRHRYNTLHTRLVLGFYMAGASDAGAGVAMAQGQEGVGGAAAAGVRVCHTGAAAACLSARSTAVLKSA